MPMTPEQMRDQLVNDLSKRAPIIAKRRQYYDGQHPLTTAPVTTTDEYKRLAVLGQANLTANIVDAVVDRLQMTGLRGDDEIWPVLQDNGVDAEADMVHEEAAKVGWSYVLVWPGADDAPPSVTPEDATEMIVGYQPGSRHIAQCALKVYRDAGVEYATLWTDTRVHFWKRPVFDGSSPLVLPAGYRAGEWQPWGGPGDTGPGDNTMGVVPVEEFRARQKLYGPVTPELSATVMTTQDRINKTMFDLLVTSEYQAFPQRVTIGIEQQTDPTGKPVPPLKAGPNRVWELMAENPKDAQVFQLNAADLKNHLQFIEADMKLLAAQSRTPLYALAGDLINISGDTVNALSAALVSKAKRYHRGFDTSWERVGGKISRALRPGSTPTTGGTLEIVWADPETYTFSQRADAALKMQQAGYPFAAVARMFGATDDEVIRLEAERRAERADTPQLITAT